MPSFDIVSEVDMQEVDNAVNQAAKEIGTRFDFRGGKSNVEWSREEKLIKIIADDDMKLRSIHQILEQKLVKRNVDLRALDYAPEQEMSGNLLKQSVSLKIGLDKEAAKKVTKAIKNSKIKVQAQIQDEQVRVTSKKIDDLQGVMQMHRGEDVGAPLQFVNMRS